MKTERSCGAVIYRRHAGRILYLLLKHRSGNHWSLAKGHGEAGETDRQTARREVFEETGLVIEPKEGFQHTITYTPRPGTTKDVVYFVAKAKRKKLILQDEEILNGVWLDLEDALKLCTHPSTQSVLLAADNWLRASK